MNHFSELQAVDTVLNQTCTLHGSNYIKQNPEIFTFFSNEIKKNKTKQKQTQKTLKSCYQVKFNCRWISTFLTLGGIFYLTLIYKTVLTESLLTSKHF